MKNLGTNGFALVFWTIRMVAAKMFAGEGRSLTGVARRAFARVSGD